MTIIDSILAKFGLMRVEDHIAETNRLNLELAKQDNALSEAKAEAHKATGDLGKLAKDYGTRGDLLAAARRERAQVEKDLEAQSDEINRLLVQLEDSQQIIVDLNEIIYELRPDAEKFRAKAARDAEQKKAKRAAAKKGAAR